MHHQQQTAIADETTPELPGRNRAALDQLLRRYQDHAPLTVLLGAGRSVSRLLIDAFLECIDDEVDVVRLVDPSPDPMQCLRVVVQSLGFDTEELGLSDLRQILMMFLSYQKTHRRRTILCVEAAHTASPWTLDLLNKLVEEEIANRFGLLVVLSGERALDEVLRQPHLTALSTYRRPCIRFAPFDRNETRTYIHRRIEATGRVPISEIFEFDAIDRVHDISEGEPEMINQLVGECLVSHGDKPISPKLVERAASTLQLAVAPTEPLSGDVDGSPTGGQLLVRHGDRIIETRAIESERLLIGRTSRCDLKLPGSSVSRSHAMLLWLKSGVRIIDLGSTNGTVVNGDPVLNWQFDSRAVIRIGEYDIEFIPPDPVRP